MYKKIIDGMKSVLVQEKLASLGEIRGCEAREIAELEERIGFPLPGAYRDFLFAFGRGAGGWLSGTDWTISHLLKINKLAIDLLHKSCPKLALPQSAFVFAMHQGYSFLFFVSADGQDPPVYLFVEGNSEFSKVCEYFTKWALQAVKDETEEFASLPDEIRRQLSSNSDKLVFGE